MKKILLFGPEVSDFLNPLAGKLKELGFTVDVIENRKIPRDQARLSQSYSNVLNYQEIVEKKTSYSEILKIIFSRSLIRNYFKIFYIYCLEGKCKILKSFRNSINQQILKERFSPILNKYDIINFHSISPGILPFIKAINPEKKIVLSFWGSDLFQINGVKNYYEQLEAIKRADKITVMSHEMEFMIASKFGSEFKKKIVRALLGIDDKFYDLLDKTKKLPADLNFLKEFSIPENKIKITICYCGNPICNHLPILDELTKLDRIKKEKIHLLVPMTYGNFSKEYFEEVINKLDKSEISYTLFEKYLSFEEVYKLRVASDLMIMMARSDALSQSVNEAIYSENLLISAVWLPYSPFRLANVFYLETDFMKLSYTVSYALDNLEKIKVELQKNPERVKSLAAFNQNWQKWKDVVYS